MGANLNSLKPLVFIATMCPVFACVQHKQAGSTAAHVSDAEPPIIISDSLDSVIEKYPYWVDTMGHNTETGYKDTFSVGASNFRMIMFDSANDSEGGILEIFTNAKWQPLLTVDKDLHRDYSYGEDKNNDGYKDFVQLKRFASTIYFYSPITHTFDIANGFESGSTDSLIDADKNIYCDESNIKGVEENTRLYTFNGTKPVILYSVEFGHGFDTVNEVKTTTAMRLYKEGPAGSKPVLIETLNINISNDDLFGEFDYVKFWKDRYRKLLNL